MRKLVIKRIKELKKESNTELDNMSDFELLHILLVIYKQEGMDEIKPKVKCMIVNCNHNNNKKCTLNKIKIDGLETRNIAVNICSNFLNTIDLRA